MTYNDLEIRHRLRAMELQCNQAHAAVVISHCENLNVPATGVQVHSLEQIISSRRSSVD